MLAPKQSSIYSEIRVLVPNIVRILTRGLLFCLVLESIKIVPPYIIKTIVDSLIQPTPDMQMVYSLVLGILAVSLLNTLVESFYTRSYIRDVRETEAYVLKKSQKKLLELDLAFHEKNPSGELVHLLNTGAHRLVELLWFVHDQFLGATLQIILTSIVIMHEDFTIGLVFIAFMPIVLWMLHRFGKQIQPHRKKYHKVFREASWKMNQSLLNVRTVKDFAKEEAEELQYQSDIQEYLRLSEIRGELEISNSNNRDYLLSFGRVSILFYVVYMVFQGRISPGSLFLIATLSEKVIASLFRLGRLYNFLGDAVESISQLAKLLKEETTVTDEAKSQDLTPVAGEISFEDVTFAYPNGAVALADLSFKVPSKKVVAVVGRSGSGKSSLVKLLFRHYDISSGSIKIDGVQLRDYPLQNLRRSMALVSQDIEVFDMTVAENISYGCDASIAEIENAAKFAYAHEFILDLPQGYNTKIGERGVRLSGGQRQRLGIARALLVKPKILIFDEATSSLDTESEKLIQKALSDISGSQTMIVIAHRLSTIRHADLVLVFESGRLIEHGSYDKLLQNQGTFARMLELQKLGELRE